MDELHKERKKLEEEKKRQKHSEHPKHHPPASPPKKPKYVSESVRKRWGKQLHKIHKDMEGMVPFPVVAFKNTDR